MKSNLPAQSLSESDFRCLTIPDSKKELWDDALSDVLCWLEGFKAGGGHYSPASENTLRDLRDAINRAYSTIPPNEERWLAEKIAEKLFDNAERLVMETGNKKFNASGWCKVAAVDRIEAVIKEVCK